MPSDETASPAHSALKDCHDKQHSTRRKASWLRSARQKLTSLAKPSSQRVANLETAEPGSSPRSIRSHLTLGWHGRKTSPTARRGVIPNFEDAAQDPACLGSTEASDDGVQEAEEAAVGRRSFSSVLGSIRGITRMTSTKKSIRSADTVPTSEESEDTDGPSAPIPIPKASTAPTLSANLLPQGFSPMFGMDPAELEEAVEASKLTDPLNTTTGLPQTPTYICQGELATPREGIQRSNAPTTQLNISPGDRTCFAATSGPPTPLPGTNAEMDLDGCSDIPVFERSVETPTRHGTPGRKAIRPMRSIDAMASVDHAAENSHAEHTHVHKLATLQPPYSTSPRAVSVSTVGSAPPDMRTLCRQVTPVTRQGLDHGDLEKWTRTHPSTPVIDPVTPLIYPLGSDVVPLEPMQLPSNSPDDFDTTRVPSPTKSQQLPIRLRKNDTSGTSASSGTSAWPNEPAFSFNAFRKRSAGSSPDHPVSDDSTLALLDSTLTPETSRASAPTAPDYDEFKTQHLFGDRSSDHTDNHDLPAYEEPINSTPNWRTHGGATPDYASDFFNDIAVLAAPTAVDESNPRVNTSTVGLLNNFWKFDMNRWLRDGGAGPRTDEAHSCPSSSSSEDEVEVDADALMGSRVKFDLSRSERNMRYNTLSEDLPSLPPDAGAVGKQVAFRFSSSPPPGPSSKGRVVATTDECFSEEEGDKENCGLSFERSGSVTSLGEEDGEFENALLVAMWPE